MFDAIYIYEYINIFIHDCASLKKIKDYQLFFAPKISTDQQYNYNVNSAIVTYEAILVIKKEVRHRLSQYAIRVSHQSSVKLLFLILTHNFS